MSADAWPDREALASSTSATRPTTYTEYGTVNLQPTFLAQRHIDAPRARATDPHRGVADVAVAVRPDPLEDEW